MKNNQATATATQDQEVVCNHKPGDVWAEGCCTSAKDQKATTATTSSSASTTSESIEESINGEQSAV